MINYMNSISNGSIRYQYSTPSKYINAVKKYDIEWPVKTDDGFPYSDQPNSYWTGFYTSRPTDKIYIRDISRQYHSFSQLAALKAIDQRTSASHLNELLAQKDQFLDIIGIMQHHDAVTGTAQQHVSNDYKLRMANSIASNKPVYSKLVQDQLFEMTGYDVGQFEQCERTNTTYYNCPVKKYSD